MIEEANKQGKLFEEDAVLITAFQSGDKKAFDRLVPEHMNRVFNLCYRFMGDYEEANDCAQETFIKVYRSLNGFKFQSSFSTWLYRITVNTCKNRLKSVEYKSGKKMISIDEVKHSGVAYSVETEDKSLSPITLLDKKETEVLIQSAIDSLPEEQKEIIVLRDIEGLSYEEIANITDNNLGTVKSKLSRARSALKEKLKGLI